MRTKRLPVTQGLATALDELLDSSAIDSEDQIRGQLNAELTGLGVLQPYIEDSEIEEIWINQSNQIHIWRSGQHQLIELELSSNNLRNLVHRMLKSSGRRIDRSWPFVDAALADGSRLHVVIPEVTNQWSLNIRKFKSAAPKLTDLLESHTITISQYEKLRDAIAQDQSILISGATQAGKTTLMSALLGELSPDQRLVSAEDTFELALSHPDWVAMQTRPGNSEGLPEINLRELVKQSLRMRPSRIAIGEVRGAESLDMLIALNSGIPGICTLHANSAKAAIRKLLTLPLLAGENITESFLRPTIIGAFDLAVHCERSSDGKRRVSEILEVDYEVFE